MPIITGKSRKDRFDRIFSEFKKLSNEPVQALVRYLDKNKIIDRTEIVKGLVSELGLSRQRANELLREATK